MSTFTRASQQARRFVAAEDQIHVLDGLAGGSLHQIVDGADDDGAPGGSVELEPDIAKIGAVHNGEIGPGAGLVEAHESFGLVMAQVDIEELFGGLDIAHPHVDGFEDAAFYGQQVRGEAEFRLVEAGDHQDFGDVAMIEHRIDGEVVGDFAEAGLEGGLAPGAAHAGLGVADDSGGSIGHPGCDQRLNGKVRGRGVTAGIRDQASGANSLAAELGKPIDGLREQLRRGVLLLVPARIGGGVAQAEGAAEIDHLGPGVEHGGRQFHGDFGRRGEEHDRQFFGANGVRSTGRAARLRLVDRRGSAALILPVFQEDGLGVGMGGQQAEEFSATVAVEADDADLIFIHRCE
jgi:hypothetical protein